MERLEAIILAGGSGSRFGGGKLLAPYRGGALIDGALRAAMAAPVERIIVVTGHDGDKVSEAVGELAARDYAERRLLVVHAARHRDGMAETLKAGVAALSSDVEGAFLFLGDMPRIPPFVTLELSESIGGRAAAAPIFNGRRGHPVLFSARLFPDLMQLRGDQGARQILDELKDDLALVAVDDAGVLFDVDQWSELAS